MRQTEVLESPNLDNRILTGCLCKLSSCPWRELQSKSKLEFPEKPLPTFLEPELVNREGFWKL